MLGWRGPPREGARLPWHGSYSTTGLLRFRRTWELVKKPDSQSSAPSDSDLVALELGPGSCIFQQIS